MLPVTAAVQCHGMWPGYLAAKQVEQVAITVALEIQLSNCPTTACEKESYSTKKVMTNRQALEEL